MRASENSDLCPGGLPVSDCEAAQIVIAEARDYLDGAIFIELSGVRHNMLQFIVQQCANCKLNCYPIAEIDGAKPTGQIAVDALRVSLRPEGGQDVT
jgi:hypothetical protein